MKDTNAEEGRPCDILMSTVTNLFIVERRMAMTDKKKKDYHMGVPVEKHDTAAWANIESKISHSEVTVPSEEQTINAKDYVDANEK